MLTLRMFPYQFYLTLARDAWRYVRAGTIIASGDMRVGPDCQSISFGSVTLDMTFGKFLDEARRNLYPVEAQCQGHPVMVYKDGKEYIVRSKSPVLRKLSQTVSEEC